MTTLLADWNKFKKENDLSSEVLAILCYVYCLLALPIHYSLSHKHSKVTAQQYPATHSYCSTSTECKHLLTIMPVAKRSHQLRALVRRGIPDALRGELWWRLSGAQAKWRAATATAPAVRF